MYVPDNASSRDAATVNAQTLKEVIQIVMASPIGEGAPVRLDGRMAMMSLKDKNLDVQTAIAVRMANQALGGDVKSAEWLVKAGGLEPVKEQKITVDLPSFYTGEEQLPEDIRQALAKETALAIESAKEDDAAVEVDFEVLPAEEGDS